MRGGSIPPDGLAPRIEKICADCGKRYTGNAYKPSRCKGCAQRLRAVKGHENRSQEGSLNPMWRGGHRHWQEGKLGRDKEGLSWKRQRRLTWERDEFQCQWPGCSWLGADEPYKRPHVHHKIPYALSRSHALSNLICYCPSHHRQAEYDYWLSQPVSSVEEHPASNRQVESSNLSRAL